MIRFSKTFKPWLKYQLLWLGNFLKIGLYHLNNGKFPTLQLDTVNQSMIEKDFFAKEEFYTMLKRVQIEYQKKDNVKKVVSDG